MIHSSAPAGSPHAESAPAPNAAIIQPAIARLLRPLVRLLIRSGITFPMLGDLLREIYVNVAEHEFKLDGKPQTDSRVSLLTGIHRKEVSRLRGAGAPVRAVPQELSRTSRILARWMADPDYTDGAGRPRHLPRGGDRSFESLVESVTRDVRSRAVLDEWLDRNLVQIDGEDRVALLDTALIPRDDDHRAFYFGRNLHDHMAAATANILAAKPRFFERAVHYDGLSAELAGILERKARELATESLQTANRDAHAGIQADAGGVWRWNFGVYILVANDTPAPIESITGQPGDPP